MPGGGPNGGVVSQPSTLDAAAGGSNTPIGPISGTPGDAIPSPSQFNVFPPPRVEPKMSAGSSAPPTPSDSPKTAVPAAPTEPGTTLNSTPSTL